ncbi:MAG: Lrp/AsnC ligand binding domain-containing protein [Bacteroidales bacterium]|nr:Lrp/AsnC ligand binding domain-containing protein [Bacteroidales bacterium]
MMGFQLDTLDYKILTMLSENARRPYLEIARECGVSGAAVHQRVQKLYAMNVIKEAITVINPSSLGFETCAYIGLLLKEPSKSEMIIDAIRKIPEVVECYYTTGQYDMFIKIYAKNNEDLLRLIQKNLSNLSDTRSETLICFREVFKRQIPVAPEDDEE